MFTREISDKLKYYVYRLIDPRNGETFYVGKGKGNRVFQHVAGELVDIGDGLSADEDIVSVKMKRINEIRGHGHDVIHVIHRHGLDNETALEVEAALIDAYPGLTNVQNGKDSDERGLMHYKQILTMYQAMPIVFKHKAIVISVNFSLEERGSVYEAVRYAWRLNPNNARSYELVLAVHQGVVKGVFVPDRWLEATVENFPGTLESRPGRWGFIGKEAPEEIAKVYMGRRVPNSGQNPVRYMGPESDPK